MRRASSKPSGVLRSVAYFPVRERPRSDLRACCSACFVRVSLISARCASQAAARALMEHAIDRSLTWTGRLMLQLSRNAQSR
eukprot:177429-Prymnesium_polylepis.1